MYRWHSATGEKDGEFIKPLMQDYTDIIHKAANKAGGSVPLPAAGQPGPSKPRMVEMLLPLLRKHHKGFKDADLELGLPILGLQRQKGGEAGSSGAADPYVGAGYFRTQDLARALRDAGEEPAGHLGANMVPTALKAAEIVCAARATRLMCEGGHHAGAEGGRVHAQ